MTEIIEKGHILTANRLGDGIAVFFSRTGAWSEQLDEATLALEKEAAASLEKRGLEEEAFNEVTGTYLVKAERRGAKIFATDLRERMRTLGPTVRMDLGKQAEGKGGAFAIDGD